MSVPGPAADHNNISIRIFVPRHEVRVRKPKRLYPVPGYAHAAAHKAIIAAIALVQLRLTRLFLFRRRNIPQSGAWLTGWITRE